MSGLKCFGSKCVNLGKKKKKLILEHPVIEGSTNKCEIFFQLKLVYKSSVQINVAYFQFPIQHVYSKLTISSALIDRLFV